MVDVELVLDGPDRRAAVAGVVRGYHGRFPLRGLGEYPAAGQRGGRRVDVEGTGVGGSAELQRAVGEIADEDGRLTRVPPQHRGSRRVPGRGPQPQGRTDLVIVRPQDELARFVNGRDAVREHQLVAALLGRFLFVARRLAAGPSGAK